MKTKPYLTLRRIDGFRITIGLFILVCSALLACSGGGGGGGSNGDASLEYTGARTAASLTPENSEILIGESFSGALTSDTMVPSFAALAGSGAVDDEAPAATPIALDLQAVFADSLSQVIDPNQEGGSAPVTAAAMQTSTIDGDCGGSATYSVDYNESSGTFSGSFSYNSFCSGGVNLSGSASFSGRIDSDTGFFDYFSFTFSSLTTTTDGLSNTISGTLECDFQGSDVTIITDMVVELSSNGERCWLNNYTVQVTGDQMEISGRFYHPVHGYIDFVTLTPLTISEYDQYPSAGQIEFMGAVGIGGQQTKAQLSALSATTCQVIADTDGDGIFDYDTGEILWTQL